MQARTSGVTAQQVAEYQKSVQELLKSGEEDAHMFQSRVKAGVINEVRLTTYEETQKVEVRAQEHSFELALSRRKGIQDFLGNQKFLQATHDADYWVRGEKLEF